MRLTTRGVLVLGGLWLAGTIAACVLILAHCPTLADVMRGVSGS